METQKPYYKQCIEVELASRIEKNPGYSLRAFAIACRLPVSTLSEILSEKRVPSYKVAQKLIGVLDLNEAEQTEFLKSLALKHQARGLKRISPLFKKENTHRKVKELNLDLFRIIGDWYHYGVLLLTYIEAFEPNPKWIAHQLGIREVEARLAVERLLRVGLIKEQNGTYVSTEESITTTDKHLTTPALRRHQKQILEKAIYSLEHDPIEIRNNSSNTMAIDPEKLPEAKKMIAEFTKKLSAFLESGRRTQVYELGISLYPLQTKSGRERLALKGHEEPPQEEMREKDQELSQSGSENERSEGSFGAEAGAGGTAHETLAPQGEAESFGAEATADQRPTFDKIAATERDERKI